MVQRRKMILILALIIVVLAGAFLAIYQSQKSTSDLVVNGSFEDGMKGWKPGSSPPQGGVVITSSVSKTGSSSLLLIGGGEGYIQDVDARSILPGMLLSFYTRLSPVAGEKEPWALFRLYFLSGTGGATYHLDITVTPDDSENLAAVFEPSGDVYLRYNRNAQNYWIPISVDMAKLLERYLPDLFDPQVSGIMLVSAEGGKVYFDDISLICTSLGYFEFAYLSVHYFLYGTVFERLSQSLGFTVIGGACVSIYHWWKGRRKPK